MLNLGNHLLYIDVTSICPYHCAFCMYGDVHTPTSTSLKLDAQALITMSSLVNLPRLSRISISGEGEPLMNIGTILDILALSEGGRNFEIITSGFMLKALERLVEQAGKIIADNQDTLNLRISLDSYHINESTPKQMDRLFDLLVSISSGSQPITVSFRSIECDREEVRSLLTGMLGLRSLSPPQVHAVSPLEDSVEVPGFPPFRVIYKNMVYPRRVGRFDAMSLDEYVTLLERIYHKPFTFGNLNSSAYDKGLDITVKPHGEVLFYGLETRTYGSIFEDEINEGSLVDLVATQQYLSVFYQYPLLEILRDLQALEPSTATLVSEVNNPYWVVKELHEHFKHELDTIVARFYALETTS